MEFPDLGQSCQEASCRQLDFLPVQCSYCQNIYCKDHSFPDKHNCEHVPVTEPDLSLKPSTVCSLPSCKGKEVEPFHCRKCGAVFCVTHRHAADHNCPSLVSPEQTKVLLAPTFPSVLPGSKGGRKNAQLSTQVKLMKLKQSAKGVKELPAEERIYFALSFQNVQHSVFVSQHWSIGKAIDCIAALVQARNTNNAGGPKLELVGPDSEVISATKDNLISELIQSKVIANGESLVLEYR